MIRLYLWFFVTVLVAHASLIPYGENEGDTFTEHSPDNTATVLSVPFVYFENKFTDLYISPNGAVSFGEALPAEAGTLKNKNAIAVYYAKTTGGNIYHKVTKDEKTILDLTAKLVTAFSEAQRFRATEAVLVTYEDMAADNSDGLNLFQLGLLTNGTESYAILIYSRLDYSSSAGRYAEMGFFSANGKTEFLFNSGTANAQEVSKLSMLSEKGVYSYKTTYFPESGKDIFSNSNADYEYTNDEYDSQEEPTDCPKDTFRENCPNECNMVPDSRGCKMCVCKRSSETEEKPTRTENTDNGDSHEPDNLPQQIVPIQSRHQPPASSGCSLSDNSSSSDVCHANGFCDASGGGFCCKCLQNFFGNGKDCILKNASIRATGKFEGVISGQSIAVTDFYTFIDTAAGQQHTAINGLSQELAWSLQLLDAIGNGMAWLFAKVESPDVENGFQLTGGILNRTLNIHLGDKHSIVIKQEFLGRENDALKVNIFVRGTLPTLDSGATVTFTDFEDKYTREEAGFLRAYADRHITVKQGEQEVQHRVTVDQQIRYKECPYRQPRNNVVVRVSRVSSHFEHGKTLRFGSQGAVYNEEDAKKIAEQNSNPCINSYHVCNQPNMFCKPENGQYRCECEAGYQYLQDDAVEPKFRCVDANECSRKPCHKNAECVNTVGSFTCRCLPGYNGDGKECTKDESEGASATSGCRSHSECHQWGECVFSSGGTSGFCKCRGWYVGDGVTSCGPPQVSYNVEPSQYNEDSRQQHPVSVESCEKRLSCHFHAQCVATGKSDPPALCQCRHGFEGNGTYCTARDELAVRLPTDSKVCSDQSDCHQFAHCTLREAQNTYYCSCLPGYKGDGHTACIKSEECDFNNPSSCGSNSECRFSYEAQIYRCECASGFVRQGEACVVGNQAQPQETCNVNPYVCHPEANCVLDETQNRHVCRCQDGKVGDGYINCAHSNVQLCTTCGANSECIRYPQHGNYTCVCKAGFSGDGNSCQAVKSCLDDRSLCSPNAQCVPDQRGLYVCNCNFGYSGNGYVCNPTKEDMNQSLLIGRGMSIIQRSTDASVPGRQFIVVPYQVVVDIAYDCISDRIFWSDIAGYTIRSASSNGTDTQTLFKDDLRSPEGIAIDYASRNIYYVDSIKDEIGVITMNGKYQKALLNEGLVNPRALAIDLDNRKLYYSDWHRRNPRIGRVDLDGKSNQDFIKDDIGLPNGLTLLPSRRELCWVDAGKKQLNCIRTDGTGRRVVYAPLEYPFGLTHENEERFYWTDWKDHKIHTVSIYGEGYRSFVPSVAGQGKIYGILSLNHKCQGKQTECSNNNGGCQYICVPGQHGATCVCPDNVHDAEC